MADQGTYTATNLPSDGTTIDAADVNTDLQGLIDEFNKNVGTTKITNAAVDNTKLSTNAVFLGKTNLISPFTSTATSTTDITNLTVTVTVPSGGRQVKITLWAPNVNHSSAAGNAYDVMIREGSTTLAQMEITNPGVSYKVPCIVMYITAATAGSHTYKASFDAGSPGTFTMQAQSDRPAFIEVELI